MSTLQEPTRLAELGSEAPESLRRLFAGARHDLPTATELSRIEAKLGPLFHAPPPAPAPSAAGLGPTAKLGVLALGSVAVAGAIWFGTRSASTATQAPAASTFTGAAPQAKPLAPAPSPAPEPAPAPSEPGALTTSPSAVNTPQASPLRPKAERPEPRSEESLLEEARKALSSNPQRALLLTREHAVAYPGGVLTQEREVIAIEALRRLGRTDEADQRLERFEKRFPQSAHRRKLEGPATTP